ncbi:hypothetical protein SAMN02799630_00014 [Paenibacillus sp. UNCCL117]|nr:hypothetical protein SAMN04488602_102518 [Paenibacillus sp. cl123]SFW10899.1 hypothetical protein SAMN02799630_00014 [Paenibacillus sp. UNCCL117]
MSPLDTCVVELSSFQLMDMTCSPYVNGDNPATATLQGRGRTNYFGAQMIREVKKRCGFHPFGGTVPAFILLNGLFIAKNIVEQHQGAISAQSDRIRTLFEVRLPQSIVSEG